MALSFGKQKQSAQGTSESASSELSFGENLASSFGTSGSESSSSSFGTSSADQRIAFEDLFKSLYGGSAAAAAGLDPTNISGAAKQLFSGGLNFLEQLQGGDAGTRALEGRLTDTSGRDAQLETLRSSLGDFFNEELIPGITAGGVATGTLGGSRDAVEKAQAAKAVAGQFSTGAAQIISGDQAQRDAAAGTLSTLKQQGAQGGLNALNSLLGLVSQGEFAALSPYEALASIFGGPTVLGSSQSTDVASSLAQAFSEQGSQSYGFDFGVGSSSSKEQHTSSGRGFNIGF